MKFLKAAVFSVFFVSAGLSQAQNLISNGSFEDGTFVNNYSEPGIMLVGSGSKYITDWAVIGTRGGYIASLNEANTAFPALYGNRFLDMTGISYNPIGQGVLQTIDTVAGMQYTLGFDIGNSTLPNFGATSSLLASAGGISQTFTNTGNDGINSWQHFSLDFVATGSKTDISLLTQGGGNYIGLDNVSVMAAVPEPQTYGMLLGGLGLIGFALARRKNKITG
jgi:hypothetical protein